MEQGILGNRGFRRTGDFDEQGILGFGEQGLQEKTS